MRHSLPLLNWLAICTVGVLLQVNSLYGQANTPPPAQPAAEEGDEKVIVVQLVNAEQAKEAECYQHHYDGKRIELHASADSPLSTLTDDADAEEMLIDAGCFTPSLKLIFDDHTYVLSMYCTSARKFKNTAPFTPGPERLPNDLVFTETLQHFLEEVQTKQLGFDFHSQYKLLALNYSAVSRDAVNLTEMGENLWQDRSMQDGSDDNDLSDLTDGDTDSLAADANKPVQLDDDDDDDDANELDKAADEKENSDGKPKAPVANAPNNKAVAPTPAPKK